MNATAAMLVFLLMGVGPSVVPLSVPPLPQDVPLVSAAPQECLFYYSWAGRAEPRSASKNHVEALLAEPEVQQFAAAIWKEITRAAAKEGGPPAEMFLPLAMTILNRPASMFVSDVKVRLRDGGPPDVDVKAGIVLNAGDAEGDLRKGIMVLERMMDGEVTEVTIDGVKFRQLPVPEEAPTVRWGFSGGYLVVAVGDDSAKRIVTALKAARGPPAWMKTLHERLPVKRPAMVQYVNIKRIADIAKETLGPAALAAEGIMTNLGLDNVQSLGSVTGLGETDMESKTLLAIDGKPRGLMNLFAGKPLKAEDLINVPKDATWASVSRFDAAATYKQVFEIVGNFSDLARGLAEGAIESAEEEIGLSLLDDILQPLGDTWTLHNAPSQGGGFLFTGTIASVNLRDAERFQKTHDKLLRMARDLVGPRDKRAAKDDDRKGAKDEDGDDAPPRREDPRILTESTFHGYKIYQVNIPAPVPLAPCWCIAGKSLLVALYPQTIKAQLTRTADSSSLADVPAVAALLERGPSAISYTDTEAITRFAYPILKVMAPVISQQLRKNGVHLDASILPSARAIYPHLGPTVAAVSQTKDGILFTSQQSSPGAMNTLTSAPILAAMLLPAVQSARSAARRQQSMNNLKQLAIAMHNFHDVNGSLPAPASYDADGKPLLSWRVHILPYIEQDALYRRFKLDEPWDSQHNRKLIAEMPQLYACVQMPAPPSHTRYVVPFGPNTMFPKGKAESKLGVGFADIRDGTSNTMMIVELGANIRGEKTTDKYSVIWTKPEDLEVNFARPRASLFGLSPRGTLIALGDGSVRFLSEDTAEKTLKALFTRNGREVVEFP